MKTWKLICVMAGLLAFLSGCHPEGRVYVQHKKLSPNIEWLKKDVREFQVPIENTDHKYNLSVSFRYANGYQFQVARVQVTEVSPSGKEQVNAYELKVRDENGDYIGEPGFDIWDSEHLVEKNKQFPEAGTYTYRIEHNMPQDPLNFAMEIGVILDEAN